MQPVNNFRYSFNNRFGLSYVVPLGEYDFKLEWSRQDESKLDYSKQFPNRMIINGEAYKGLLRLETSIYRCEFTSVTIERLCGGVWGPWFTGQIRLNDGEWNLDNCQVEIKINDADSSQCFENNKTTNINLFTLVSISKRKTVRLLPDNLTTETVEYQHGFWNQFNKCPPASSYWGGSGSAEGGGWAPYYEYDRRVFLNPEGYRCEHTTRWARYVVSIPAGDPSPGTEWVLVSTSSGVSKYAKKAVIASCDEKSESGPNYETTEKTCQLSKGTFSVIDNGMHLADLLPALVSTFCPGVTVVSNFFQINPTAPSNINYVTGQKSKVKDLIVYQKSDVKRPNATGNATGADANLEQILDALVNMFNTRWRIVGNQFIIEHVSYFTKGNGFDLTQPNYTRFVNGFRRYTYTTEKIPEREEFKFMEATAGDFAGVPIRYTTACVPKEGRGNVNTYSVDKVTTDINLCLNNPNSDSTKVDDHGLVIVATEPAGIEYKVLTEAPILSVSPQLNNTLGWAQLHRDYHKYYRPQRTGFLNDVETAFYSVKPLKKGETISIPLRCNDTFNPDDKVITPLGVGIVDKATYNFRDCMLSLELLYESEEGTTINLPPVATTQTVFLTDRLPRVIDLGASDPDGTIERVEIVLPPMLGTIEVRPDKKVVYTPKPEFTNTQLEIIVYRVYDNWNQPSNNGGLLIRW